MSSDRGSPIPPGPARDSRRSRATTGLATRSTPPAVPRPIRHEPDPFTWVQPSELILAPGSSDRPDERGPNPPAVAETPASQRVPFQLYDDFTTDLGPQYPATDLILHLIKLVSADVCSFKCNAFTAYLLLSDAGAICRKINRLIQSLDDSKDDTDSWDDFEKFTVAITPLEKCAACCSSTP